MKLWRYLEFAWLSFQAITVIIFVAAVVFLMIFVAALLMVWFLKFTGLLELVERIVS